MDYREHAPPAGLVPWLDCIWERTGDGGVPVRVLPDGCIDVVWTGARGAQLVGANTTAFLVSVPGGARVVGARLRPGAAPALLGIAAELVRDARLAIGAVLGDEGARLGRSAAGVSPLAAELGVSERALRRRVTAAVGYGPKRLGRILRLERALAAARAGQDLGRVAADAGYADQAHFSHDCRELAGLPPSALMAVFLKTAWSGSERVADHEHI